MFGFRFEDDADAAKFLKKIMTHVRVKGELVDSVCSASDSSTRLDTSSRRAKKQLEQLTFPPKRLSPAMVSPPAAGTFVHVSHVGFNFKGEVETSRNVEPGWTMMLEELQGYGVTRSVGNEDKNFVDGFITGVKATPPPPVPAGDTKPYGTSTDCYCQSKP